MEKIYAGDPRFWGQDDSQTLQNAIDYAEKTGLGEVTVPRMNDRTGKPLWELPRAVLLPSDMTVYLAGCHIRHGDDTMDNLFRNKNMWTPLGKTEAGRQRDIRIIGLGRAVLDGGKANNIFEQTHRDNPGKYPGMLWQCAINLANVENFEIRGIRFQETRYWALCFHFCSWGILSDLHFHNTGIYENQDGIDLRLGCEFITVQNITGITGDDTVALTALPWGSAVQLLVEGRSVDIHDITIRNVIASTHGCGVVRFLCEGGAREYNITVDGLKDTTGSLSGSAVLIGTSDTHFADPPHGFGDFKNIVLRNITTCAQRGISIGEACRDLLIENLATYGPCKVGVRFYENFQGENVVLRSLCLRSQKGEMDSVFCMDPNPDRVLKGFRVEHVVSGSTKYLFRGEEFPVEDFCFTAPTEGRRGDMPLPLPSAYARYHYMSYGRVLDGKRPPDNRFDGTLRTPLELAAE